MVCMIGKSIHIPWITWQLRADTVRGLLGSRRDRARPPRPGVEVASRPAPGRPRFRGPAGSRPRTPAALLPPGSAVAARFPQAEPVLRREYPPARHLPSAAPLLPAAAA